MKQYKSSLKLSLLFTVITKCFAGLNFSEWLISIDKSLCVQTMQPNDAGLLYTDLFTYAGILNHLIMSTNVTDPDPDSQRVCVQLFKRKGPVFKNVFLQERNFLQHLDWCSSDYKQFYDVWSETIKLWGCLEYLISRDFQYRFTYNI